MPSFTIYYPHPTSPILATAEFEIPCKAFVYGLFKDTLPPLPVNLGTAVLLKAESLPVDPCSSLLSRTCEWLRVRLDVVADEDQHILLSQRVSKYFASRDDDDDDDDEATQVDIVVVTDEIIESLDIVGELQFTPERVLKRVSTVLSSLLSPRVIVVAGSGCAVETAWRLQYAPSPSDGVKDTHGITAALFSDHALVHGGRPAKNYGPPPPLFHSALAQFDYHLRHLDDKLKQLSPDPFLLHRTHLFIQQSLDVYDSENERSLSLRDTLTEILRLNSVRQLYSEGPAGWVWEDTYVTVIVALKNESGIGGNALLQAALVYANVISNHEYSGRRLKTNHPVILIGLAGDHLELSSAIFLGDDVHQSAPFAQRLCLGFHAHDNIFRLAQAFKAVTIAAKSILGYYADLNRYPPPAGSTAHMFPNPTRLDGDPLLENLRFKCRLSRAGTRVTLPKLEDDRRLGLYIASMPAPPSSAAASDIEVVVKFTARYNVKAHRLLAEAGLAPRLYSCSRVLGELYMVVMEFLPGKTMLHSCRGCKYLPWSVYADIEAAIQRLHAEGIVFGDLRLSNIMCFEPKATSESVFGPEQGPMRAKLIDFDWAGVADVERYPAMLDDSLRDWAPGVERYGVMRAEHDLAMLEKLRWVCG